MSERMGPVLSLKRYTILRIFYSFLTDVLFFVRAFRNVITLSGGARESCMRVWKS